LIGCARVQESPADRKQKVIAFGQLIRSAKIEQCCVLASKGKADAAGPTDLGHWEIDTFSMGTIGRGDSAGVLPAIKVDYGALKNVEVHITTPIAYNSQGITGTEFGAGDVQFGVESRFLDPDEHDWWPQIAVYPTVMAEAVTESIPGPGTVQPDRWNQL
jgi:hypothetical protein